MTSLIRTVTTSLDRSAASAHMVQLDTLRTLAVAAVAWSHWAPRDLQYGLPWGTGVQLFFVLSGFLITGILLTNKPAGNNIDTGLRFTVWRRFYVRRCLRIFPLFYLVLSLALALNIEPIRETWMYHCSYLSNVYYFTHGRAATDPFVHLWSLAVEEQFYVVWPFVVLLLPLRSLQWCMFTMILLSPAFRVVIDTIAPYGNTSHYLPFACLDALGIGGLFALLKSRGESGGVLWQWLSRGCLIVGLSGALIAAWMHHRGTATDGVASAGHSCLVLFYAWLVSTAAKGFSGVVGRCLEWRPLVYLGKISYGLYVFHYFVGSLTPVIIALSPVSSPIFGSLAFRLGFQTVLTVGLAIASWHAFEKPLNGLKRFFPYTNGRSRLST